MMMKNNLGKVLALSCMLVLALPFLSDRVLAQARPDAGAPTLLMLPFQVNGGADLQALESDLPDMLAERLTIKGFKVIPVSVTLDLLRKMNIKTLDINAVRRLITQVKADAGVYGSFNQIGSSFSIDSRLVYADPGVPTKPLFVEKGASGTIINGVDDLADKISTELMRKATIAGVEVRGTKVLDPEVILMRINSRRGDPIDPAAIDKEVRKIWDLGYFSDVSVNVESRPDGHYLVYTVQEKPRIESIVIEGASEISEDNIKEAMGSRSGAVLNDKVLAEDIRKIRELYHKDGYYLVEVTQRIDTSKAGGATLVLNISEGKRLYIKEVKIEGAEQMSESEVKKDLALSERSIISWITGTGILKEELLERDSSAIGAFYLNHGFLDVNVGAAKVDYQEDGIVVTFVVKEGPRYRLGTVDFAGDLIDTDDKMRSVLKLDKMAAKNEYFDLSVMHEDAKKLGDLYSDYGYAFAEANGIPKPRKGGEHIVDVTYSISKRQKVYVRRVVLEGNTKTRDNVILREMRLTDDDQFEGQKLRRSMERLNKLGYFEVADSELVPTGNENEVDLKIKVKEKNTGALMGGVGYSTYSAMGVSGTIMERNLWGKGYALSFQAFFSGRRTAYIATFVNPRLYDTEFGMAISAYNTRDDYYDYKKTTIGSSINFFHPIGEYTTVGFGYRLDQYNIYDVEDDATWKIRDYEGYNLSSVVNVNITRDTTDMRNPSTGTINYFGVEYGGGIIGGSDKFIGIKAENQIYYKLADRHILHSRVQGRALFENGNDRVPIFERFWMGGIDTVRGYNSRDIVPVDAATGDRVGGTRMAFVNLEYIWSMSTELGLNLVPFFDMGFNYASDQDWNFDDELKKSVGLEMRWRSPMGDLRFCYGIPLDKNRNGSTPGGRFEFSMGQFF